MKIPDSGGSIQPMPKTQSRERDLREVAQEQSKRIINITMGSRIIQETIRGNVELNSLDPEELIRALNRAGGKFAYYGALRADAKRVLAKMQADFDMWLIKAIHEVERLPEFRGKKSSDKSRLNHAILQNMEEYGERKNKIITLEQIVDKLWVLQQGFDKVMDNCRSILAFRRTELEKTMHGEAGED